MKVRSKRPPHLRLVVAAGDTRRLREAEVWLRVGGDRSGSPAKGRRVAPRLVVVRTGGASLPRK